MSPKAYAAPFEPTAKGANGDYLQISHGFSIAQVLFQQFGHPIGVGLGTSEIEFLLFAQNETRHT